jgi:hypothetical protein
MLAATVQRLDWSSFRLTKGAALRGLIAGAAWGVTLAAGLVGLAFWDCGIVCPDDVVITTGASLAGGILSIGPLAAFARA